jgi:hypothetical protein
MPFIRALSGKLIKVPEGLSDEEALDLAKSKFPKEFADTRKAEEGLIPSIKSGAMGLASNVATAAAPLLGMSDDQTRRMIAQDQARQMETSKTPNYEEVKEAAAKYGVFGGEKEEQRGGLSQLMRMWRGQLGESLPQMGATIAGARLGAGAGALASPFLGPAAPVAPLVGGALGALGASIPGFIGSNVKRQADEQEKAGKKEALDYGIATAAAVPQAGVDAISTLFVLGKLGMGATLTKTLEGIAEKVGIKKAEEVLARTAQASLLRTGATGAAKGVAVEMPTEIAQAVLERAQAGLNLFDEDARKEYEATAVGVAGPGAVFGVAGGISGRSAARDKLQELSNQRDARAAQIAQQQAFVAEQQKQALQQQRQATVEAGYAPEGQGRLFGGEATPLPVAGNMQQLYKQMQEAEANGDTQRASQLRNDMQRLQSELNDPEALAQRRQQLLDARDALTDQANALAGKDSDGIDAILKKDEALARELVRVDALIKQAPPSSSREQAEKKLKALNKQMEKAKTEGDIAAVSQLTKQVVKLKQDLAQSGDLLAGVPELDMLTATDRTNIDFDERNPQAQVQQQPKQDTLFADEIMDQLDAAQQDKVRRYEEYKRQQEELADIDQVGGRAESFSRTQPLKAILFGRGIKVGNLDTMQERLDKLQKVIDSGKITGKVASLLGLSRASFDLSKPDQAAQALQVIETRLRELNQARITEFPDKELVKNGMLTEDGQRLMGVEATIGELKRLQLAAQSTVQKTGLSPAESGLLGVLEATTGKGEVSAEQQEKKKAAALKRATDISKFAEQRSDQMFNWGNEIDSLRKGDNVGDVSRRAAELRAEQIALLAKMEAAKRVEQTGVQMSIPAQERLEQEVKLWLSRITKNAKPGEPEGALQNELRDKLGVKQGAIDRGMTITDTKTGELARLQQGVDRLILRAVEKYKREKPKKQKGPFGLTQQSAAVLSDRYDAQQAAAVPEEAPEPDLSGKQREMFPGSVTEVTKKKQAVEKRTATVESKKQAKLEETKALLQKVATEKEKKKRRLERRALMADIRQKLRAEQKEVSKRNAKERLASLVTLKDKLENEIAKAKADAEAERLAPLAESVLANIEYADGLEPEQRDRLTRQVLKESQKSKIKLKSFDSLSKLTSVQLSGETKQYLRGLDAQLNAVNALITKTQAEVATADKREKATAALQEKQKPKQFVPAGQVITPEDSRPPAKKVTPEEQADRDAMTNIRERVETQEAFVAEAEETIDAEIKRIDDILAEDFSDTLKGRGYARQDLELLADMEFAAGLSDADIAKLKTEARINIRYANAYRKVVSLESFRQKLRKENAVLQKAKADLKPFKEQLKALQKKEASIAQEQRVKALRARVLKSLDAVAASMQRTKEAQVAETRRVEDILADIAQGSIKGSEGLRGVPKKTLTLKEEQEVTDLEDQLRKLDPKKRPAAALRRRIKELKRTIGVVYQQKSLEGPSDLSEIEAGQTDIETGTTAKERAKEAAQEEILLKLRRQRAALAAKVTKAIEDRRLGTNENVKARTADVEKTTETLESAKKGAAEVASFGETASSKAWAEAGKVRQREAELLSAKKALERAKEVRALLGRGAETLAKMTKTLSDAGFGISSNAKKSEALQARVVRETIFAENRQGKRTPAPLKTGLPGYTPEFTTDRDTVDQAGLGQQRRAADDGVDFRDATDADTGVDLAEAQAIADRVKAALPEGVDFIYAPTLADAPAAFQEAVAASGRKAAKGAVMPDGRVVVIGEAHSSPKDVEETIAHELIGHYGADMVLGPEGMKAMVADMTKKGLDHIAEVATGLGLFPDVTTARMAMPTKPNEQVMTVLVREMIAHAAEGRRVAPRFAEKVKTFIRDVISKVRGFFRNAGLSNLAKADTKAIQKILNDAERALSRGRLGIYKSPDGQIVFRSATSKPEGMSDDAWELTNALVGSDGKRWQDQTKAKLLGIAATTAFDSKAPVKMAAEIGVKKGLISDMEAVQNIYTLSQHGKVTNHTLDTVQNGPRELVYKEQDGEKYWQVTRKEGKDVPTLLKVFASLDKSGFTPEQYDSLFTLFLASKRIKNEGVGIAKLSYRKDKNGNLLVTEEKLTKFEKEIASNKKVSDAFEEARRIYNAYNEGLINFAVQAGALSKELAAVLKAKKDFIPFYREKNGEFELVFDDGSTPISIGNIKDQPYLHELVGGDQRILPIFQSAVQNTRMLTDMALRNLATKDTAMLLSKLGMTETYTSKKKPDQKNTIFKGMGSAGPNILRFKLDGEDVYIKVKTEGTIFEEIPAELLVKGMEGIKTTFPPTLRLLGLPAKLLRHFIVLSPIYPIRSIIRESLSAWGTSGADFTPILDPIKNLAKAVSKKSETVEKLQREGLGGGQLLSGISGNEEMAKILRSISSGKTTWNTALAWLEATSMLSDTAIRATAYDSFIKQKLNPVRAWVATNEIMDYNRKGTSPMIYIANTMYPFFATQLQGLSIMYRAMSGRMPMNDRLKIQDKFIRRGLTLGAMTLAYAAMMQDDEAYQNASPEARLANWFVRIPGVDAPLKIPIPFEYGLLFKAIPEAIYHAAFSKEDFAPVGKALAKMAANSIPGAGSYFMPQIAKPIISQATGVDLFTGANVETPAMQKLDPAERYKEGTTELAKMLGAGANISPARIDQFIKDIGSGTLLSLVSLANPLLAGDNPPSASMKPSKYPLVGGMFQPTDAGAVIDRVYEKMEEAVQAKNTYTKLLEEKREDKAEAYLNANIDRIMLADSEPNFKDAMKQLTDYEKAIRADEEMLPSEKREKLDEIRRQKIETAKAYRDALREAA